jgi:uncharacterized protein YndB with AHSA1/START domain
MAGREVTVRVDIAAPPDQVWPLITDVMLLPRFSTELQDVVWAPGSDGPVLGARFIGRNSNPAVGEWTTTSQIVEFDPPRAFGWTVGDPESAAATWRFTLADGPAGSRLGYRARLGPGPSGVTMLIGRHPERAEEIIASRLAQFRANMMATLAGIRDIAEGGSGG